MKLDMSKAAFLSIRDIAEYLGVSYQCAHSLVLREIPYHKVGGLYRIGKADFEGYMKRKRVGANYRTERKRMG